MMRNRAGGGIAILVGLSTVLAGGAARAQGAPPAPPQAPSDTSPLPIPDELLRVQPGGLTAEQAGVRAARTSWSAKASMENVRSAAARVDEAWAAFLPRLSAVGKYTRLSNFTSPVLFNTGGGNLVGTLAPPGLIPAGTPLEAVAVGSIPFFVLDNWLFQATITVPISDYLLRTDQSYSRSDALEAGGASGTWRPRAPARTRTGASPTTRGSTRAARSSWPSRRSTTSAPTCATRATSSPPATPRRQTCSARRRPSPPRSWPSSTRRTCPTSRRSSCASRCTPATSDVLVPGEDLEAPVPSVQGNLRQMTIEALASRPEVKSADANAAAAQETASAAKASRWPTLSAFGDGILGDPNPRYIPPTNVFNTTWDLGAQITWSPNDLLTANGNIRDLESRVAAIVANKNVTRDNIEVEVTQMLQAVHEADFSIESSTRELASAQEAYRVQRELFNNGRGTSTTLADAESDLTRARLDLLNARVNARTARIRLEHALGRDARTAP